MPIPKGSKMSKAHRKAISDAMIGNQNRKSNKKQVSYQSLHTWVRNHRGKPSKCAFCDRVDQKKYEWANVSGE